MARILKHYTAEAQGGATFYAYSQPDDTSSAVRVYAGSRVKLPADYYSRETNHMWPTIVPGGWMFYYNVGSIEAVYETVPDTCTPPDSVTLSGNTLIISGGDGVGENYFRGWAVSWRERGISETAWGKWGYETVVNVPENEFTVPSGVVRQYRVRTRGSEGVEYYSDYVICETLHNGNAAAGAPTVELPVAGAASRMHSPCVRVICPPEPDGDSMKLERRIDNTKWTLAADVSGEGGLVIDPLPALSDGEHVVEYRLLDINGMESPVDRFGFTVEPDQWTRPIAAGTVISNDEYSHQADLAELLSAVNTLRAFYGMGEVAFPGTVGRFADWRSQMETLLSAVEDVYTLIQKSHALWPEVPAYPAANVVNAIREACGA